MTRQLAAPSAVVRSIVLALAAGLLAACTGTAAPSSPAAGTPPPSAPSTPSPQATVPAACPIAPAEGALPSEKLVDVELSGDLVVDRITFTFEPGDTPGGPAEGRLEEAQPPFTQGASGLPLEVKGRRFVEIVFHGLFLYDDQGTPTYAGPTEFDPDFVGIRHLVQFDASEGVMGWIVGIDGPGCVTLGGDSAAGTVVVEVQHLPG